MTTIRVIVVAMVAVFAIAPTSTAFAANHSGGLGGISPNSAPLKSVADQISELRANQDLSEEEVDRIISRMMGNVPTPPISASSRASVIGLPGTYLCYSQIQGQYCVPACIQALVKYVCGVEYSQSNIASALGTDWSGTDFSKVRKYINDALIVNGVSYTYVEQNYSVALSLMKTHFYNAIASDNVPVILSMKMLATDDWEYIIPDDCYHAANVNGISSAKTIVQLADPYCQYDDPSSSPYYQMAASDIHKVVTRDNKCGYVY